MRFLFTGGGTLGSVTPLLAVAAAIKAKEPAPLRQGFAGQAAEFLWAGTRSGPEQGVVAAAGIKFYPLLAGKFRRYWSWRFFIDPFLVLAGFWQALFLLARVRPQIIVSAGGFVGVPVIWAGWLLGVPVWVHQQDVQVGLANRLAAPFARKISVALPETAKAFPSHKVMVTGNPVSADLLVLANEKTRADLKREALAHFGFEETKPVILVMGGGTGAASLNKFIGEALPELVTFCQVLHLTGPGKEAAKFSTSSNNNYSSSDSDRGRRSREASLLNSPRYCSMPFVTGRERLLAFALADLTVCRAGLGTISECAAIGLPMILAPIESTHQEANARYFEAKGAARVIFVSKTKPAELVQKIKEALAARAALKIMAANAGKIFLPDAAARLAREIIVLVGAKK